MTTLNTRRRLAILTLLLPALCLTLSSTSPGDDKASKDISLPDDSAKAWQEVQTSFMAMRPRPTGQPSPEQVKEAKQKMMESVGPMADKALAFVAKFPKDENVPHARQIAVQTLSFAAACGDQARQKQFDALIAASLGDNFISEDERVSMILTRSQVTAAKRLRYDPLSDQEPAPEVEEAMRKAMTDGLLDAQKQFPQNRLVYAELLGAAKQGEGEEARRIARVIADSPHAPEEMKKTAQDIADGKRPYEIGKPLNIKFTAADGREVDLSKLKGKVVLIDFWATWCGPCVAEVPNVVKTYQKLHEKGFEIIGISFDQDKGSLTQFVKEKGMPWPQFFDGKGWQNSYGTRYGIDSIPRMWLVGKDGNLADTNARGGLEQKVQKLLEAKSAR